MVVIQSGLVMRVVVQGELVLMVEVQKWLCLDFFSEEGK